MEKWDYIKAINFCLSKGSSKWWKEKPTEWEKRFPNCTSANRFIFRVCKGLKQFNSKETKNLILKIDKRPEQLFLKRRHANCQQVYDKCLSSLNSRKMHLISVRMTAIKNEDNNGWWGWREGGPLSTDGGNVH
jgi:hypothetical protein